MKYNEIQRLQQLAGIITEIRINKPSSDPVHNYIVSKYDPISIKPTEWDDKHTTYAFEDGTIIDYDPKDKEIVGGSGSRYHRIKSNIQNYINSLNEIKINKPLSKKLDVELLYDNEDEHGIGYSDIDVSGFYYDDDDHISSLFNIDDDEELELYDKLISLLDTNGISDFDVEDNGNSKIVHVPLKYVNIK